MTQLKTTPPRKRTIVATTHIQEALSLTSTIPSFDVLPNSAFVRQSQLVRDPKHPTRPAPLPFSASTFWRRVQEGTFPKPVKLGQRITCWRVSDVRAWLAAQQEGGTE